MLCAGAYVAYWNTFSASCKALNLIFSIKFDVDTEFCVHVGKLCLPQLNTQGGSAWTWSDQRRQWYYHQFGSYQPDLNLRNPKVQEELEVIISYGNALFQHSIGLSISLFLFGFPMV